MKKEHYLLKASLICVLSLFLSPNLKAQTTLISTGSSWKYLDNGSNQGTSWRNTSFSDSGWKTGNAQLGYGDGDEATVVSYGSNASAKYATTYFRKSFNVNNPANFSGLTLNVKRDDGVVVYINGVERYRNNMPTGTIYYNTLAASVCSDNGGTFQTTSLNTSSLTTGTNVIAVEIHQCSATSSDISFDLELKGTNVAPSSTSPNLISTGSSWKYLDNGSNQGTAWRGTSFSETSWKTGNAELGYGDGGEATVVSYGSNSSAKYITTYFRKTFSVTNPSDFSSLLLRVKRDDGVVVYINGTERYRNNMPTGTIAYNTAASTACSDDGGTFQNATLSTSAVIAGTNVIAVEIHQNNGSSSDISFDLDLTGTTATSSCTTIGCFTSVMPTAQTSKLVLPSTHTFQMLFKQGSSYSVGGTVPGGHDFTGYLPISGSSQNGYLSINHENSPGAVSILDINYNTTSKLWSKSASKPVPFSSSEVVKTERNCSGGITPWGTIITCEETRATGDANGDGYTDTGWHVEIDPATKTVKQYGNGKTEKLWALGRMSHENIVVSSDRKTAYYGEDATDGAVYKFVANNLDNLSSGTLYVLKLSGALSSGEPTSSTGSWVQVPNTTKSDRNNTYSLANSLGATQFNGVEDVEIASNGQIYFTSKGNGRVYRFTDNGTSVSSFQTFVGGKSYTINYGSGSASEAWGTGNDNLAFDGDGNLWVLQDGGRGHTWVVKPSHTQTSPKVELFATTPAGGEATGITFSPDKKFMFLSIQHPSSTNGTQVDASGTTIAFNGAATIVIARKENLGNGSLREEASDMYPYESERNAVTVYPSMFETNLKIKLNIQELSTINVSAHDMNGRQVKNFINETISAGEKVYTLDMSAMSQEEKSFIITVDINGKKHSQKVFRK